jgi:hypothetical protein
MTSTTYLKSHLTEHSITVEAAPADVLRIVADAQRWPYIFRPTVHVRVEALDAENERLHMWALGAGTVRAWTSLRTVDAAQLSVSFRQERCAAPAASLGGEWMLEPLPGGHTRVVLLHHFQAVDDDPESVGLIKRAMDQNSTAELAAVKEVAELGERFEERVLSFCDALTVDAAPEEVYDFLYRADRWPERLPHVARLELQEVTAGRQAMTMDTRNAAGEVHTTSSVRVCLPERLEIAYKQTVLPPIMAAHVGRWVVAPMPGGARVVSHHTVVLRPDAITEIHGAGTDLAEARRRVRDILGANSRTTMSVAGQASERRG